MSLRTTVLAQQSQIRELQSADRRRQTVILEMLAVDHRRHKQLTEALKLIKRVQTQMAEFKRQQGPAKGVTTALAARDANTNGVDSHNSRIVARRNERATRLLELALLCGRIFPEESDKIEKYVSGLPNMIHRSVVTSKPKTMQEATKMAIEVMDKRIRTFADCQTETKRKPNNNQQPQQHHQNKRQNTGKAYAAGTVEKKPYGGSRPLCSKCNYHHDGPCTLKCHKCNKVGHFARDCRSTTNANNANHPRGTTPAKRECPKLKNNNNRGNQVRGGNASAKVYAVGHAGINPKSNVVTGMFLLTNHYASILFDTGADRSFVSTAFSS
ncbi:reverse transcriptase domain-containing protein [Tanacetum coccineum]